MKAVRALSRQDTPPPAEPHTISLRCCGQSPSGLLAEPRGKDLIAPTISSQDTCRPCSGLVGMVVASMIWGEVLGVCSYEQCCSVVWSKGFHRAGNTDCPLEVTLLKLGCNTGPKILERVVV